jgi:hypothetical protein
MDAKGIMSINDTATRQKAKDERVIHQQRALLLTSDDSIARYREYQREKEMAPILRAVREHDRQRARDERDARAAEAKVAQNIRAAEAASKREAKEAEKRRWDALSREDQKAETAAKRRRTREAKAASAVAAVAIQQENEAPNAQLSFDDLLIFLKI